MCPNKYWFNTFKSFHTSIVVTGNNIIIHKVIGIRIIKVRILDRVARILINVMHVPDFRKKN